MTDIMPADLGQPLGADEWAAREEERLRGEVLARAPLRRLARGIGRLDARLGLLLVLAAAACFPLLVSDAYLLRMAGLTGLYVILALGLNVVAGLAGLLDLGYVAFFGLGAYAYALLASPQFDLHWPFWLVLPLAVIAVGLCGLLLGSPSLRLSGDYLAIVTLGFGQIASLLLVNLNRLDLPFLHLEAPLNITGGPNGIIRIDDARLPGFVVQTVGGYYYLILAFVGIVFVAVYHLDRSRIGRAWRAIREDELAAQAMGVDTRRLKLLAFSVGAAIAGAAGVLFAAWQGAVFPPNFDTSILIILYAMVVLGGVGSLWGALAGAVILSVLPEALRSPELARLGFYALFVGALVRKQGRERMRGLLLLGGVIALGLALRLLLPMLGPEWFVAPKLAVSVRRSLLGPPLQALNAWMLFPREARAVGNVAFVALLALLVAVARLKERLRRLVLVPTLYGLAFVWETRLMQEPSTTRMLIFGAVLVLVMNRRPQGLFGQRWVQRV